jgi:hypothetical protein
MCSMILLFNIALTILAIPFKREMPLWLFGSSGSPLLCIGTMYDDNEDVGYTSDENIILKSLVIDLAMSGQLPLKISFKIRSGLSCF